MPFLPLLLCTLFHLVHSKIHLPGPSGPCQVQTRSAELIDTSRIDPFSQNHDDRAIVVDSFAPVQCRDMQYSSYIPSRFAEVVGKNMGLPLDTLDLFQLPVWSPDGSPSNQKTEYPVIIFSPALSSSRLVYANLLEQVASAGFFVLSIDHPYDAGAVEFPDGQITLASPNATANIPLALGTRVGDVIFALDQLKSNTDSLFPSSFSDQLKLDRVAIIGHSLGGATAAQAMLNDTRFAGGMNLDGAMFGSVVQQGLDRPFINFGEAHLDGNHSSWGEIWPHMRGFKLQLQLQDSKHDTFTDLPLVFDNAPSAKALRNSSAENLGPLPGLGTLPGLRIKTILTEYIAAACGFFVTEKKPALLDGPSELYPEVMFTG